MDHKVWILESRNIFIFLKGLVYGLVKNWKILIFFFLFKVGSKNEIGNFFEGKQRL